MKAFYQQLKWVPRECIHALRAPCCVVHGETDGIIPLYQVCVSSALVSIVLGMRINVCINAHPRHK